MRVVLEGRDRRRLRLQQERERGVAEKLCFSEPFSHVAFPRRRQKGRLSHKMR